MKQLWMNPSERHPIGAWRSKLLASFVLCAGLAVPGIGAAGGGNGETIGTLPSTGGGVGMDIQRISSDVRPALYLEGPIEEIFAMVAGVTGRATITGELLDATTQIVRLTFHGDLSLELDRQAFEQGSVQIGWSVPQAFGTARVSMFLGARTIASGVGSGRSMALPVAALANQGGLELTPLSIVTSGRNGHAALDVATSGGQLILTQIH